MQRTQAHQAGNISTQSIKTLNKKFKANYALTSQFFSRTKLQKITLKSKSKVSRSLISSHVHNVVSTLCVEIGKNLFFFTSCMLNSFPLLLTQILVQNLT